MKRAYVAEKFTDQELLNLKEGKCWCGKAKEEFQNGMLKYCSPRHRQIWYSKTTTWQEFRNGFLNKHGYRCDSCGIESNTLEIEKAETVKRSFLEKIGKSEGIVKIWQAREIARLNMWYEERLQRIFDQAPPLYDVEKIAREQKIKVPAVPRMNWDKEPEFEVDHILAISNGGEEFDEDNLQVLCKSCHKDKTKEDLKEYRSKTEVSV